MCGSASKLFRFDGFLPTAVVVTPLPAVRPTSILSSSAGRNLSTDLLDDKPCPLRAAAAAPSATAAALFVGARSKDVPSRFADAFCGWSRLLSWPSFSRIGTNLALSTAQTEIPVKSDIRCRAWCRADSGSTAEGTTGRGEVEVWVKMRVVVACSDTNMLRKVKNRVAASPPPPSICFVFTSAHPLVFT